MYKNSGFRVTEALAAIRQKDDDWFGQYDRKMMKLWKGSRLEVGMHIVFLVLHEVSILNVLYLNQNTNILAPANEKERDTRGSAESSKSSQTSDTVTHKGSLSSSSFDMSSFPEYSSYKTTSRGAPEGSSANSQQFRQRTTRRGTGFSTNPISLV